MDLIEWKDFMKVDIRVGTVTHAEEFPEAIRPAYKVTVDFGPLGIKRTSAQITRNYRPEEIIGKQVLAVVNFPPKQIANFMSEFLLTGAEDENGEIVLATINSPVPNGKRLL